MDQIRFMKRCSKMRTEVNMKMTEFGYRAHTHIHHMVYFPPILKVGFGDFYVLLIQEIKKRIRICV